jgi:hypothetical protein
MSKVSGNVSLMIEWVARVYRGCQYDERPVSLNSKLIDAGKLCLEDSCADLGLSKPLAALPAGNPCSTGQSRLPCIQSHLCVTLQANLQSLKNMSELKYLGTTLTNRNCMYEKIKSRLNSGNAYYY